MKSRLIEIIVRSGLFILPVLILRETSAKNDASHAVSAASDKFAMDLYMKLIEDDRNLIISPLGVKIVLAMVTSGAKGKTLEELVNVMSYPRDTKTLHLSYQALLELLQSPELKMANNIFVDDTRAIFPKFYQNMVKYFSSEVENLPFLSDPGSSATRINEWAEMKTNKTIKNLFRPADLLHAGVVLANAVHFKAKWAFPFDELMTENDTFFISKTRKTTVKMIQITKEFGYRYVSKLKSKILEMPYENNRFSIVIILPDDIEGLSKVEKELHKIGISEATKDLSFEKVIVRLPRFKIYSELDLIKSLSELGLRSIFGPSSNLTGMIYYPELSKSNHVKVSHIKQKSFIEVNEEGTEASAVTAAPNSEATAHWKNSPPPVEFIADHPFIFVITARGPSSRNTLFVGRAVSVQDV